MIKGEGADAEAAAAEVAAAMEDARRLALPSGNADYLKAFVDLYGADGERMFNRLKAWTDRETDWKLCLQFLRRVDMWRDLNANHAEVARQVFGRPRSSAWDYDRVVGEVELIEIATRSLKLGYLIAGLVHYGRRDAPALPVARHRGLEAAMPHLQKAIAFIQKYPETEIPEDLPKRARGRKSLLRMPLPDDPAMKVRTRREIVAALDRLLQQMNVGSRRGERS